MKRRGGRPGAASCCQSAVNASLPSRLPTSPSAIFDGLLFIREKVLLEEEKRLTPEKAVRTRHQFQEALRIYQIKQIIYSVPTIKKSDESGKSVEFYSFARNLCGNLMRK